jgi:hypothetical protein
MGVDAASHRAIANLGLLYAEDYTVAFAQDGNNWRIDQLGPTPKPGTAACGSKDYEPFSSAMNSYCANAQRQPEGICKGLLPALRTCIYRDFPLARTVSAVVDPSLSATPDEPSISFQADGAGGDGRSWVVHFKKCGDAWSVERVSVQQFKDGVGSTEGDFAGPACSRVAE